MCVIDWLSLYLKLYQGSQRMNLTGFWLLLYATILFIAVSECSSIQSH